MKEEKKQFKVRDRRTKAKFDLDDEYLNGYAKYVGPWGSLVYMSLCRHANYYSQKAFPSIEKIAEELAISCDSVKRGIKSLEKAQIIMKERIGKRQNNEYVLLDRVEWKDKEQLKLYRNKRGNKNFGKQNRKLSDRANTAIIDDRANTASSDRANTAEKESNQTEGLQILQSVQKEPTALAVFSYQKELQKLEDATRRDLNIIAFYFTQRDIKFENAKQMMVAIRRHLRPAKQLISFSDQQLLKASESAKKQYEEVWTLETLIKILTK